jgi:hypothetical protein
MSSDIGSLEEFARAHGIDPDTVPVLHSHANPQTGQVAVASWPCAQCIALGRTVPLQYGRDVPDSGAGRVTEVPPDRLEAYLASFGLPAQDTPRRQEAGGYRARRRARRAAEREARHRSRRPGGAANGDGGSSADTPS